RFAGKKATISAYFIAFRVDFDARGCSVQDHRMLGDLASIGDRKNSFCKAKGSATFQPVPADERHCAFGRRAAEPAEHWPLIFGLRSWYGSVGVSYNGGCDGTALQHDVGSPPKEGRIPDAKIRQLSDLNRPNVVGNALSYRGVDCVFR